MTLSRARATRLRAGPHAGRTVGELVAVAPLRGHVTKLSRYGRGAEKLAATVALACDPSRCKGGDPR